MRDLLPHNVDTPPGMQLPAGHPTLPLYSRLRAMLEFRGYRRGSVERKLAKFLRGRREHNQDLHALDYLGEIASEIDDVAVYTALWWTHGGPQTPAVVDLMVQVRKLESMVDALKQDCNWHPQGEEDEEGRSLMATVAIAGGDDDLPACCEPL